jgi:hypothetical protein
VLANKITDSVKEAYTEMGLQQTDLISFFNFVEILTRLGYLTDFNDGEKLFLNRMWSNLIP